MVIVREPSDGAEVEGPPRVDTYAIIGRYCSVEEQVGGGETESSRGEVCSELAARRPEEFIGSADAECALDGPVVEVKNGLQRVRRRIERVV